MNRSIGESFQKDLHVKEEITMNSARYDNKYGISKQSNWDDSAGGWGKWWTKFEEGGANAVSKELVKLANIRKGQRVLDLATGYGEPATSAAKYVGSSGSVLAIDISSKILELAKERANAIGLQNLEFREADIQNTVLPQGYFNAVLCRWGLMHFRDLGMVLGNIYRSLVPKGVFAAVTWGKTSEVPMLSIPIKRALEVANESLSCLERKNDITQNINMGCAGPFSLSDPEVLKKYLEEAGFCDVTVKEQFVTMEVNSVQDYIRSIGDLNTTIRSMVFTLPIKKRRQIWDDITSEIVKGGYVETNSYNHGEETEYDKSWKLGRVRFNNKVIYIAAHKHLIR
jgi:ubiquinone/menaquinone biosynthesis C-methylase UbiE